MTAPAVRDWCKVLASVVDGAPLGTRYARLLPDLPPLVVGDDVLRTLGEAGGVCDAGPAAAWVDGSDDGAEAAGWPFFGQFVAHDITADRSPIGTRADLAGLRNAHSPCINLEALYGAGPVGAPYLFDRNDPAKLLLSGSGTDVPRNAQGVAVLGDPRNDVHLFVNQLHVAFLHAHNALVDRLRADGMGEDDLYVSARRALRWHYQYLVVNDFLPRLAGPDLVAELLRDGPQLFRPPPGGVYLPVEFAHGAYRYGHGQIRQLYRLRLGGPQYQILPDLMGFGPVGPEHAVDWAELFDFPGAARAQRTRKLDGRLPSSLIGLPHEVTGNVPVAAYQSLAVRDLERGAALGLPSGEAVARAMGLEPLDPSEVGLPRSAGGTPLWFYVLKEAQHRANGDRLGPVGGRIVAEVLIGLVRADPDSYLSVDDGWRPTLPSASPDRYTLVDLLAFAGRGATVPVAG
ncbi:heme peroxidase family protein [Actinoplanes sp. KI2]|uniref:peroxidase family protein n=1 Tax=Actinoplanes sp. KI2 TaxID=2983315 RepID=UPI0021D58D1E|nr:heme peroxidase family protein [Actinoplanes sp. KI2]MCU7729550.1 heme peroxidase family protein [Actinoplanes sp. KI2]